MAATTVVAVQACDDSPQSSSEDSAAEFRSSGTFDFGVHVENTMSLLADDLFGFDTPIVDSLPEQAGPFRYPGQPVEEQLELAEGLTAEYLTRDAGHHTDQMVLWPNEEKPKWLFTCVESGREDLGVVFPDGTPKYNPAVQRIHLKTKRVETVLRGMHRCDGLRVTPWGTILATEEASDGAAYEIVKPVRVTNATILDRGAAGGPAVINDRRVGKMTTLPTMAWEGLTILPSGVVIAGDELRPGTAAPDTDGGAIFKFIPEVLRAENDKSRVRRISKSPFNSGKTYAFQASCRDSRQQFGQGCEIGNGTWIEVDPVTARADAHAKGATGYYRPEDLHRDPNFSDPENPDAIRFCVANTGNKSAKNFGEVLCGVDYEPTVADPERRTVVVNRFIEGDEDFNAFDNLAFQPSSDNLYVIEDRPNGDIFACLPDGADRDIKSDGCVKMLTLADSSSEPTGFVFNQAGDTAYVTIQHTNDELMPKFDDFPTDDVLIIRGFQQVD